MRERRRLAAIFAADVVGYSRLMGADEAGTLARLKARRAVLDGAIGEHRGRIVKTTGDGLLAEFESAVDAVRCAVTVQRAMDGQAAKEPSLPPFLLRIGIHVGDVIVDGDDIFGDGVNIAARLEGIAEPGGLAISRPVHDQVRDRLDVAFVDKGEVALKNIARPVQVFSLAGAAAPEPVALALPDKPSIAVLPFQNMSGDPEQEYFADGMVEDIITALSRIRALFVIARNSSFTYKGRAVDRRQVGRELGVRYVLEGSVRKAGVRLRITGQLIDAATGAHVWADRFDGSLEDVFDLQDKVALSVAGAIEPTLLEADIRRAIERPAASLSAYDLYLRALALTRGWDRQSSIDALALLERAIALDPGYGLALALAGWCHAVLSMAGWADDPPASGRTAVAVVRRALQASPDDPVVLAHAAGTLQAMGGDIREAIALVDRSTALNPSTAYGWFWSGFIRLFAGQPETAIVHFETSLRLDPRTPLRAFHDTGLGACYFHLRRFDEAAALLAASLRLVPTYVTTSWYLASCYAHMGRLDEARAVIRHLRTVSAFVLPPETMQGDPEARAFLVAGLTLASDDP